MNNVKPFLIFSLFLFVYGYSIAQNITVANSYTPKSKSSYNWTIYLVADRPTLESIAYVEYTLHETFENPVQTVKASPNNVDFSFPAVGWGEFDIKVKIQFKNSKERPLYLIHPLDLHTPARVYIKIRSDQQRIIAKTLQSKLAAQKFTVPSIEKVAGSQQVQQMVEVRYYREEEGDEAKKIVKILKDMRSPRLQINNTPRRVSGTQNKVRPRHYEVWFSL